MSLLSVILIYIFQMAEFSLATKPINFTVQILDKLIAVSKNSSRGLSLRITPPNEIAETLKISESEHIGFYEVKGEIVVRKIG